MRKFDPTFISTGNHCCRWVDLAPGGAMPPPAGPEFGRLQRKCEAPRLDRREVFFPYFEVSGYRTVMCMLLGKEAVEFGNREDIAQKATARFGSPHAFDWSERHDALGDQIKDCGVGHVAEGDGSGDSDSDSIVALPKPD